MVFASIDELLSMGGHGLYVWLAYGAGILCLLVLVTLPLAEHSRLLARIARRGRRDDNDPRDDGEPDEDPESDSLPSRHDNQSGGH